MPPPEDHLPVSGRLLSWPAVREKVGISRTTAWRLQNRGAFPRPVEISAGRVGWREEDIEAWAANLPPRTARKTGVARVDGQRLRLIPPDQPSPAAAGAKPGRGRSRPQAPSRQLGFDF